MAVYIHLQMYSHFGDLIEKEKENRKKEDSDRVMRDLINITVLRGKLPNVLYLPFFFMKGD